MSKKKTSQKGSVSENPIRERGLHIHQKDDQIRALSNRQQNMTSRSKKNLWYRVYTDCNRPYTNVRIILYEMGAVASILPQ